MKGRIVYSNPPRYYLGDKQVTKEEFDASFKSKEIGTPSGHYSMAWPMTSDALACHPSQIPAMMERNKRHGITGVSYRKDGTAVLADRGARKNLMALEGVHDKNGGYGDDHAGQTPIYSQEKNDYI